MFTVIRSQCGRATPKIDALAIIVTILLFNIGVVCDLYCLPICQQQKLSVLYALLTI